MKSILVPISAGELLDKITILEIKRERISDSAKLKNVNYELNSLIEIKNEEILFNDTILELYNKLKEVNEALWIIEDRLRDLEKHQSFNDDFIYLARQVYFKNDKRAQLKKELNILLKSNLLEEKSYANYVVPM